MKLVRLTSGEEVIGKVRESTDSIYITDGYSLVVTEPGKIGFIPFMPYAKEQEMQINKRFVMMVLDPVDEMVDQVRQMTSGIQVPDKRIVT